jgi:hypothetical protein
MFANVTKSGLEHSARLTLATAVQCAIQQWVVMVLQLKTAFDVHKTPFDQETRKELVNAWLIGQATLANSMEEFVLHSVEEMDATVLQQKIASVVTWLLKKEELQSLALP